MNSILNEPFSLGTVTAANRIVFQPMEGCDCREDGAPGELTLEKYMRTAKSGAGIIWMEANAICPEGRTNLHQMYLTENNLTQFQEMVEKIKTVALKECNIAPKIILQLTHSGRQSIRPMIAYRNPIYEETRPLCDENIVSDKYLQRLPEQYAASAILAMRAGFDGVDIKSCHGYLLQELLSAYGRSGKYGGSFENRIRLYLEAIRAVKEMLPHDFLITTRLGLSDIVPKPYGFGTDENNHIDLRESDLLIKRLMDLGIRMINVTLGNPYYNPHVNRPFRKGAYTPPESAETGLNRFVYAEWHLKETFPKLAVVGSGLSYYRKDMMKQAEQMISDGVCDFVGFGRQSLAYPMFYRDYQRGEFDEKKCCITCSKCTELMRNKCVSGCAVFNQYYQELYKEKILCKK